MAAKIITPIKMSLNTLSDAIVKETPEVAADGWAIPYAEMDVKTVLLLDGGTAGGTIIVKKGDSIQGVADTEAFMLAANEEKAIVLESGKFKHVTGENKGKVLVIPSVDTIKLAAIIIP